MLAVNNYPKISIVTPSYNQGQYIEQTILSLINQNYPNLEYIIIDGGSTDNTIDVIKKYENKIAYWVSEKDAGQSDALNKGLAKCTGDIFNWINSDDYLETGSLFKIANYFTNNVNTELLCGQCNCFDNDSGETVFTHRTELFECVEKTIVEQRINQPASFYKLKTLRKVGAVNAQLHYVMDLELWFRYLTQFGQKNILLVNDLLAHFRLHTDSKTVQVQPKFREEEKRLWHQLLQSLKVNKAILGFFEVEQKYNHQIIWNTNAVNKTILTRLICEKYFFDFYKKKNFAAARVAFRNGLIKGHLKLNKMYVAIFYHLFIKRK